MQARTRHGTRRSGCSHHWSGQLAVNGWRHRHTPGRLQSIRVQTAEVAAAQEEAKEHAEELAQETDQSIAKILSHSIPDDDVLHVPDIRARLQPQPSPFCPNNNRGGGCGG